jgi:hypothetical protein
MIIAVDPGPVESAFVRYDAKGQFPLAFGKRPNAEVLSALPDQRKHEAPWEDSHLAIEMIASYGMPVGAEVFQTCVWIGRFIQAWEGPHTLVYRKDVKMHLCGSMRAKDGNVRAALIDRYGGKQAAIGKKATPGPLFGISADVWSALAVAVTYADNAARKTA